MIVEEVSFGETAEVVSSPNAYWVKLWHRSAATWSVSEWHITEADSVLPVIGWAEERTAPGDQIEVFAEYGVPAFRADGKAEMRVKHLRVYGSPVDEESSSVTVLFTADR